MANTLTNANVIWRGRELLRSRIQVVGCYSLDLYCGATDCTRKEKLNNLPYPFPDQYNGRNATECAVAARKSGWVFSATAGFAICPNCARKVKLNA